VWLVAGAFVLLELAVAARYGLHRDELYFIVAGSHPAFGYVDQPPLAPLVAHAAWWLWPSTAAVRVVPALCGGATVVVAAMLAAELGGRTRAMVLAAIATGAAPVLLASSHLGGTTAYDLLGWTACTLLLLRAIRRRALSAWVALGVVAGVTLWAKDLLLLWAAAAFAGLLASRHRSLLRARGPAIAVAVAAVIATPTFVWQATHGWPQLTMSRHLHAIHSAAGDYVTVLPALVVYAGVAAAYQLVAGLRELGHAGERRWLLLAVLLLVGWVVVTIPGRPYYVDGMLPLVFAAGAVHLERSGPPRPSSAIAPVIGALVALPLVLPVLPVTTLHDVRYLAKINYDMGEQVGWHQLTARVTQVVDRLPPRQRADTSIFAANYGEAGALVLYGKRLPAVLSGDNSFFDWGPGSAPDATVVAVGAADELRPWFADCRSTTTFVTPDRVHNDENGVVISLCTGPRGHWSSFWSRLRLFG
jgi:hypothetical protein